MSDIVIETLNNYESVLKYRKDIHKNKAKFISVCQEKFTIAETNLEVPILTLGYKDKETYMIIF